MKKGALIVILTLLFSPLHGKIGNPIAITIEHADTPEKIAWGLMQRDSLPTDHGMLFTVAPPRRISLWMFNCLIDLSVAFINGEGKIVQIEEMKAYPSKMDPLRPVYTLRHLNRYPPTDPVVRFFSKNGVQAKEKVHFALEMRGRWFADHGVEVGDGIAWNSSIALIKPQKLPPERSTNRPD